MRFPRYVEPLLSAMFLSSVTTHLILTRRASADERSRLTARSTLLTDLVARIRSGERISDTEYSRLVALAASKQTQLADKLESNVSLPQGRATGWKEVLLGRKSLPGESEEQDEKARLEWEEGTKFRASPKSSTESNSDICYSFEAYPRADAWRRSRPKPPYRHPILVRAPTHPIFDFHATAYQPISMIRCVERSVFVLFSPCTTFLPAKSLLIKHLQPR